MMPDSVRRAVIARDYPALERVLAERPSSIEDTDISGATLLNISARVSCYKCVLVLLNAGANVDAADDAGVTPLMWSARNHDHKAAGALLHGGADPLRKDSEGRTAMQHSQTPREWNFTVPLFRRWHATLWIPALLPDRTRRILRQAMRV